MKTKWYEFRCTRNAVYANPNCVGHFDLTARQGHYIYARSPTEAHIKMALQFPDEVGDGFTADVWKSGVERWLSMDQMERYAAETMEKVH